MFNVIIQLDFQCHKKSDSSSKNKTNASANKMTTDVTDPYEFGKQGTNNPHSLKITHYEFY